MDCGARRCRILLDGWFNAGGSDLFASFLSASTVSAAVSGLPAARTLWARIWTLSPGFAWYPGDPVSFISPITS